MNNSKLTPIEEALNMEKLSTFLGCRVGKLSATYWAFHRVPCSASNGMNAVEDKLHKSLAPRKINAFLRGARLALLKSAPYSLSIYYLSLLFLGRQIRLVGCFQEKNLTFWNGWLSNQIKRREDQALEAYLCSTRHCSENGVRDSQGSRTVFGNVLS